MKSKHPAIKKVTFEPTKKSKMTATREASEAKKADSLEIPKHMKRDENEPAKEGTKSIHIMSTNTTHKVLARTERIFSSIIAAKLYMEELSKPGKLTSNSKDGHVGTIDAAIEFETNYDVRKILKGIEPKEVLRILIREKSATPRFSSPKADKPSDTAKSNASAGEKTERVAKASSKGSSKMIVLKQLCQELKIEPRKARQKLRALEKAGKLSPDDEGRWQWTLAEVDKVKALLLK